MESGRHTEARVLSPEEAKAFYDHFGSKQDLQRFYEEPAVRVLEAHADFEHAKAVVELGCGTGRFARDLFAHKLGAEATYLGMDISSTMLGLASAKLAPWAHRARVQQTEGTAVPLPDARCDRFVSLYVLDLLSDEDARAVINEARRVLVPEGRLCLASLTFGKGPFSRAVGRLWTKVHGWRPKLVGGCRPIRVAELLGSDWRVLHQQVVCAVGICTEVVVAQPSQTSPS